MATQKPSILTYDITAYLGDSLSSSVTWKDNLNTPIDFTTHTAIAQIKVAKTDAAAVESFTVVLGDADNNIAWHLSASQVATLGVGSWVYDLQLTTVAGIVRTYISGKLKIIQDVSRL